MPRTEPTVRVFQRWPRSLKARAEAVARTSYQTLTQLTVAAVAAALHRKNAAAPLTDDRDRA